MARSGILKDIIKVYRKDAAKGGYGEYLPNWSFYKNIRAYIHHNIGNQVITNDEIFDVIKLKISVRNQTDITETDRIEVNGNMYIIEFLQPDFTKRWLEIRCTRINE